MKISRTKHSFIIGIFFISVFIIISPEDISLFAKDPAPEAYTLAPESMLKKINEARADVEPELETARDFKLDVISTRIMPGGLGTFSKPIVVVNTPEGEFVIKRINAADDNDAAFPVDYPQFLKRELRYLNIPAIPKKGTSGTKPEDFYTKVYNKRTGKMEYYQVERWATGRTISRHQATDMPDTLRAAGHLLGSIHSKSRNYQGSYDRDPEHYSFAKAADMIKDSSAKWRENLEDYLSTDELNVIDSVVREIRSFWTTQRLNELPIQPITSDLNFGNMFFNKTGDKVIGAIDWDQVRKGYWHEDFFSTLVHTGRPGEGLYVGPLRKDLEIFMEGYREGYGEDFPEKDLLLLPAFFTVQPMVHIAYAANNLSGDIDKDASSLRKIKMVLKVLKDIRKELGTIKDIEATLAVTGKVDIPLTAKTTGPTADDDIKTSALVQNAM
ncbi:phosphotransferase enzyme family protein [Candidatus Auribacterota bacterium]